ncbi:hypothetical protein V8C86DRAFT_2775631 [Haematococcus lacustris]
MVLLRSLSLDEQAGSSLLPPPGPGAETDAQSPQGSGHEGKAEEDSLPRPPPEEPCGSFLPDQCIKLVQGQLIANEAPGVALLHLLSMASVCKQWRQLASELASGTAIAFDGFDNKFSCQLSVQKFRRLQPAQKEQVFHGAAKLLTGYTDVLLSGDGISDRVLQEVALKAGTKIVLAKVQSSSSLTDAGLCSFVTHSRALETLEIDDLSKQVNGKFLTMLFENCDKLQHLHLSNIPQLNWTMCKEAALRWSEKSLTKLHVRGVNLDVEFGVIISRLPHLRELEIDGPARNIKAASIHCPLLHRVSYQMQSRALLDEALAALGSLKELRQLELIVKHFTLCTEQLRTIGMLPLTELRLDSFIYKQQPTLSRSSYSHVDNEGVKALVDSICNRWCAIMSEMRPLKLSLCGATALTHDAVSALLRLPILTELDIGGCCRIIAMDKMRLVAKVRAGLMLCPNMRSARFPGLVM